MNTAFVATVGKGALADIRPALVKSISETNPSFLLLFATNETKTNANDICQTLNRTEIDSRVHVLTQPKEDVEALFKEMLDAVSMMMRERSVEPGNVTADFTTGTKSMSAALVLAAVRLGLGRLKYIAAGRDGQGKVCPGGERTLTFEPAGFRASLLLDSAVTLMRQYRFDAVRQLLADVPEHLLSDTEKVSRTCLLCLASAYSHWDLFRHTHFQGEYSKARFGGDPGLVQFKAQPETVRAVLELGKALEAGRLTDLAVVDLINNARRRKEEGKLDDATARLYRACEMLAQWRLASSYGIVSGNVDLSKVPNGSKHWLEAYRDPKGDTQIGLRKAYRLLDEMRDSLGKHFHADRTLPGVLRERNESILAHGTKPVEPAACRKLLDLVESLAKGAIADYESKSALLRFPWSR
jgi:CRISPR-associated protein (TIGR02710 family)